MKVDLNSLKDIDKKEALSGALVTYRKHNLLILSLFAGALIGYSVTRINSLNSFASGSQTGTSISSEDAAPVVLQKISLDEDTVARLQLLAQDQDVEINSNLPGDRDNPFDDGSAQAPQSAPAPEEPTEPEQQPASDQAQ